MAIGSRLGIRARATVIASVIVSLALAVGAALLITRLRADLDRGARRSAELRAQDVATLVANGTLPSRLSYPGEDDGFVQVVDRAGTVITATANVSGESPVLTSRPGVGRTSVVVRSNLPIGDGQRFLVAAVTVAVGNGSETVYAGVSLKASDDAVRTVSRLLLFGIPGLVTVVAALAWWTVGRSLRPVAAISAEVADISVTDLNRRVPEPPSHDEIGQLARTMNNMLERLDSSVRRQQRFVADASHELRSPLTILRAELELALTRPSRPEELIVTIEEALADTDRLGVLVSDLLLLARLDATPFVLTELVDFSALVDEVVDKSRATSPVRLTSTTDGSLVVFGDTTQLHRMVQNLLDNSTRFAISLVTVSTVRSNDHVTLTVSDDGPGIDRSDRSRVFERFTRLDDARDRNVGGAGLGLSIVKEVVIAHRGTVEFVDVPTGSCVLVRLPMERSDTDREVVAT